MHYYQNRYIYTIL